MGVRPEDLEACLTEAALLRSVPKSAASWGTKRAGQGEVAAWSNCGCWVQPTLERCEAISARAAPRAVCVCCTGARSGAPGDAGVAGRPNLGWQVPSGSRQRALRRHLPGSAVILLALMPPWRRERIILAGQVRSPLNPPSGYRFHNRRWKAPAICATEEPSLAGRRHGHPIACHFAEAR